jgi:hypothetical protein
MRNPGRARVAVHALEASMHALRQHRGVHGDAFALRVCQSRARAMTRETVIRRLKGRNPEEECSQGRDAKDQEIRQ